jgi:hypothetical protein
LIRIAALVVAIGVAAVFVGVYLRYRALPWQPPERLTWCDTTWERDPALAVPAGRQHEVTRQPPLIGTRIYSPYTEAQRQRRSSGEMARPCGGELFSIEDGRRIAYIPPG